MMLSTDFDRSVEIHKELGLEWMDLWGDIYGVDSVDSLNGASAERAAAAIRNARLQA